MIRLPLPAASHPQRISPVSPSPQQVLAETAAWVDQVVIGLNLCPFAKAVQVKNQVRYVVSEATPTRRRCSTSCARRWTGSLQRTRRGVDTTPAHPSVGAERLHRLQRFSRPGRGGPGGSRARRRAAGRQLPSAVSVRRRGARRRHQRNESFALSDAHLLREESVDRAVAAFPNAAEAIFGKNIRTMEELGRRRAGARCRRNAALARAIHQFEIGSRLCFRRASM